MVLTLVVHTGTKWEVIMFIMVMELKLLTEILLPFILWVLTQINSF